MSCPLGVKPATPLTVAVSYAEEPVCPVPTMTTAEAVVEGALAIEKGSHPLAEGL